MRPVLFILYINDITSHVKTLDLSIYADNTTLTSRPLTPDCVRKSDPKCKKWLARNDLALNTANTQSLICSTNLAEVSQSLELLGLLLDGSLRCGPRILLKLQKSC